MSTTVIGNSLVVEGEIEGEERVVIYGTVKGKIEVKQAIVVESSAVVEAEIDSESVQIAGQVKGRVTASARVEITSEGRVVGDLRAPRILIADGAQFKGHVEVDERGACA